MYFKRYIIIKPHYKLDNIYLQKMTWTHASFPLMGSFLLKSSCPTWATVWLMLWIQCSMFIISNVLFHLVPASYHSYQGVWSSGKKKKKTLYSLTETHRCIKALLWPLTDEMYSLFNVSWLENAYFVFLAKREMSSQI